MGYLERILDIAQFTIFMFLIMPTPNRNFFKDQSLKFKLATWIMRGGTMISSSTRRTNLLTRLMNNLTTTTSLNYGLSRSILGKIIIETGANSGYRKVASSCINRCITMLTMIDIYSSRFYCYFSCIGLGGNQHIRGNC